MTLYGEYTTVNQVRAIYLGSAQSTDDTLLLSLVRQASREIEAISHRLYYPRIETQQYDTPRMMLTLDDDLLEMGTLTNGDGNTVSSAQYRLYPLNKYPKQQVFLVPGVLWYIDGTTGSPLAAISVQGTWGYSADYASAWIDTGATLAAAISTTSATTFTCTTGKLKAGDLIQVDAEWMYVSSVSTGTSDTATVVRGVNGSTAAAHLIAAVVKRWTVGAELEMLCAQCAAAYYRLRSNPTNDTTTIDGVTFVTPKDVTAYMRKRLEQLALIRTPFA